MTPEQAALSIATQQYTNDRLDDLITYQATSHFLDIGILTALIVLIIVVGVLNRPRNG